MEELKPHQAQDLTDKIELSISNIGLLVSIVRNPDATTEHKESLQLIYTGLFMTNEKKGNIATEILQCTKNIIQVSEYIRDNNDLVLCKRLVALYDEAVQMFEDIHNILGKHRLENASWNNATSIVNNIRFLRQWLREYHPTEYKTIVKEIEQKKAKLNQLNPTAQPQPEVKIVMRPIMGKEALLRLYKELLRPYQSEARRHKNNGNTYIATDTTIEDFLGAFGVSGYDMKTPVVWCCKSAKNGAVSRRALLDLLYQMGYTSTTDFDDAKGCFVFPVNGKGKQSKLTEKNISDSEAKGNKSEYRKELAEILKKC